MQQKHMIKIAALSILPLMMPFSLEAERQMKYIDNSDSSSYFFNPLKWSYQESFKSQNGGLKSAIHLTSSSSDMISAPTLVWPVLSNFFDSTFSDMKNRNAMAQNVSIVGQYIRSNDQSKNQSNWRDDHLPSQGWAGDFIANDIIPWGAPGYPPSPPQASSLIGVEADVSAVGFDINGTRQVISADCKPINGNNTLFGSCHTIFGGGDTGSRIGGTRQITADDVFHTSYEVNHSVLNTIDNMVSPGTRDIWLGDAGKVAFGTDGRTVLRKDDVTGFMQITKDGFIGEPRVITGGAGYTNCKARLTGGGGGGVALACDVINGSVSAVRILSGSYAIASKGNDFESNPSIQIDGDGEGGRAEVHATPLTSSPIGAGMAIVPTAVPFKADFRMEDYMVGREMVFNGEYPSTIYLPEFSKRTMRLGIITLFINRGTSNLTIKANGNQRLMSRDGNVILKPNESGLVLLDLDANWLAIGTKMSPPFDEMHLGSGVTDLTSDKIIVSSSEPHSGVRLHPEIDQLQKLFNDSSRPINVFPPNSSSSFDRQVKGKPISLASGQGMVVICTRNNHCLVSH